MDRYSPKPDCRFQPRLDQLKRRIKRTTPVADVSGYESDSGTDPDSDLSYTSSNAGSESAVHDRNSLHLPLVVFEYESGDNRQDRWRLLWQCIAYLRLARMQVEYDGTARSIVMACYVTKDLTAEVYLMTTGSVDGGEVRIYRLVSFFVLTGARYWL